VADTIQDRLDFIKMDEPTKQVLRAIQPLIAKNIPLALDKFYDHIKSYPELMRMFGGQHGLDRAKKMQYEHWLRIAQAKFDNDYVQSVNRVGNRHNIIGLEPKWYIGGYSNIAMTLVQNMITQTMSGPLAGRRREELSRALCAFLKALLLDIDLSVTTYMDAMEISRQSTMTTLSSEFENEVQQIVTNLLSISENSSSNVQMVAAAAEELSASINEISSQVGHTANSARETAAIVEQASVQVARLNEAANKIGQIVDMIRGIAEQTNLLALNATIEAARAGEAGKGFAVVASEVKNLAGKTSEATKEIVEQVQTIQLETQHTVEGIGAIVAKIADVQERSASVAAAVEEQQAATAEISRSVYQASSGTQEATSQTRVLKDKVDGFLVQLNKKNASKASVVLTPTTESSAQPAEQKDLCPFTARKAKENA
jgi:methyl-accepting chemotaxis protein